MSLFGASSERNNSHFFAVKAVHSRISKQSLKGVELNRLKDKFYYGWNYGFGLMHW